MAIVPIQLRWNGWRMPATAVTMVALLSLAAPALVRAAEEPPPLDQIKGDLKAVKPGAASELTTPAAAPTLPITELVAPGGEPPPALPPSADSAQKKREADPDWLVHAMDAKPKAREGQQRHGKPTEAQSGKTDRPGAADPDLMLKIYQEQEAKEREQQKRPEAELDSPLSKPGDVGLLSDLMKSWMSPQDATLFGVQPGSPAATGDGPVPPTVPPVSPQTDIMVAPRGPNPFLEAVQPDLRIPDLGAPGAPPSLDPAGVPPQAGPPVPPPTATPAAPGKDASPSPLAHPSDDKKYFPQLDRF